MFVFQGRLHMMPCMCLIFLKRTGSYESLVHYSDYWLRCMVLIHLKRLIHKSDSFWNRHTQDALCAFDSLKRTGSYFRHTPVLDLHLQTSLSISPCGGHPLQHS